MPLTPNQMDEALRNAGRGSLVFVSYLAGREPSGQALLESERAVLREGHARRHFVGTLEAVWTTRRGERVMTILAFNRDRMLDGQLVEGGYRTFNPALGDLLTLEVIQPAPREDRVKALADLASELPDGELRQLAAQLQELLLERKDRS